METAKLAIMGEIETVEPEGKTQKYPMALLIKFDSVESIRKAIKDGQVAFTFGDSAAA